MIDEKTIVTPDEIISNEIVAENRNENHLKTIVEITKNSTIERQIENVLRRNFLERRKVNWKPVRVDLIVNTNLTDDFFAIRKRFEKASAGNRSEFDEHFAFLVENEEQIEEICRNGYQTSENSFNVLGHSKCGVYVCKYADVCIRHASLRRTWEKESILKLLIFKIVEGKKTAALVRKGSKLQPIGPTPLFTSHCSVITPKEGDDLEKQFDQSQIFLYDFEGRETVKRPHHCLPYAIVSLMQDEVEWPNDFDDSSLETNLLETDSLRVIALSEDPVLQNKLKENQTLAEAATRALEHVYEEEIPEQIVESTIHTTENQIESTPSEAVTSSTMHENETLPSPSTTTVEHPTDHSTTSPNSINPNTDETESNSSIQQPPPPTRPSSSSNPLSPPGANPKLGTSTATVIPVSHSANLQAGYRQHTGILGALPTVAALRNLPGGMYATQAGLVNGLGGNIVYGGLPLDPYRGYPVGGSTPYILATPGGQLIQQPTLYAPAQLSTVAQQQQATQLAIAAAAAQQQQQQQQQAYLAGIPAGCMMVRTVNGGYALIAQAPNNPTPTLQPQTTAQLTQQQYIALNAAGQATMGAGRVPIAMVGGQAQSMAYQYANPAAPTQYVQMPSNYSQAQNQQQFTNSMVQTNTNGLYNTQPSNQLIAQQQATTNATNGTSTNTSPIPSSATMISPQKQSAATATAAAIQQQQQYHHVHNSQQQQQQTMNATNGNANVYFTAFPQASTHLSTQISAQQQQLNLTQQIAYANQAGLTQPICFTTPSGQTIYQAGENSYILAQPGVPTGNSTTTGAPLVYSAGPALHNNTNPTQGSQQNSAHSQSQLTYQMINSTSNVNLSNGSQNATGTNVVTQGQPQLVQRTSVLPQVRHHPYRN